MKTSFHTAVQKHIREYSAMDPLFAKAVMKPNKNIEDCCNYVLSQVKKMADETQSDKGIGLDDGDVFKIARHYYDEDIDPNTIVAINCKVVVNTEVILTEQEKIEIRNKAINRIVEDQKNEIISKNKKKAQDVKKQDDSNPSLTLF